MNLFEELQQTLEDTHTLEIVPTSDFYKEQNKTNNSSVKHIYNIHIEHKDISAGIFFSKYASIYKKRIDDILNKRYNGKIYTTCTTECGYDLTYEVVYLKYRTIK